MFTGGGGALMGATAVFYISCIKEKAPSYLLSSPSPRPLILFFYAFRIDCTFSSQMTLFFTRFY
jgi:hypothetical protein